MATKLYNSHLNDILFNCNEYYILDTYIALVHVSSEVNNKYLIQTYTNSKADLINVIKKYVNTSYKTIFNCINTLLERNILDYDSNINSWILVDMSNMTKSKNNSLSNDEVSRKYTGYTHIRNFFLTNDFFNMKAREKRLVIYLAQLADSKKSDFYPDFIMNLLKPNSIWLKVLRTKSKYYAKYTIEKMLDKYGYLFKNNSESLRAKDLAPKKLKLFKFAFNCNAIKDKTRDNEVFELIKITNPNEYALVMDKIRFADVSLSRHKIMHLIRSISTLKQWFIKDRVVQLIVNKYRAIQIHQSREDIKSLPAYAAAVVKSVVREFNNFKNTILTNNVNNYECGEYFLDYVNQSSYDVASEITKTLSYLYI